MFFKKKYNINNIFHCTIHKAGSQWIRKLLTDPLIISKTELKHFQYQNLLPGKFDPRNIDKRDFYLPFPDKTFCSPLYISYDNFKNIPKLGNSKTFYIGRNKRDLVVSYYFSAAKSHPLMGNLESLRNILINKNQEDGLIYIINYLEELGYWNTINSWENSNDEGILKLNYSDLMKKPFENFKILINYLEIPISNKEIHFLIEKYSFKNMSGGRESGEIDNSSHLRSGEENQWKQYWTESLENKFNIVVEK